MLSLDVQSLDGSRRLAAAVARLVRPGDVVVLAGEMGAGKTAFARAFGEAFGVDEPVTSPTFTLVHTYRGGRLPMHHADLYRLDTVNEVADLGLDDIVGDDGVLLVEWGDVASEVLGPHLELRLLRVADAPDDWRTIEIRDVGGRWSTRWNDLSAAVSTC